MSTDTGTADTTTDADDGSNDHQHGLSDVGYMKVAAALALITALEVALSYQADAVGGFFMPLLILLMLIKFFAVVMVFMHLKYENRLFSVLFYMGLGLAVVVYGITLFTFEFFSP